MFCDYQLCCLNFKELKHQKIDNTGFHKKINIPARKTMVGKQNISTARKQFNEISLQAGDHNNIIRTNFFGFLLSINTRNVIC